MSNARLISVTLAAATLAGPVLGLVSFSSPNLGLQFSKRALTARERERVADLVSKLGSVKWSKDAELSLALFGTRAIPQLLKAMDDYHDDTEAYRACCRAISRLGLTAVPQLMKHVEGTNSRLKANAAYSLGLVSAKSAILTLMRLLTDPDLNVVGSATLALGRLGDDRATIPIGRLLSSTNESIRNAAAVSLGQIGDVRAIDPLLNAVGSDGDRSFPDLLWALGRFTDVRVVGPLIAALKDGEVVTRRAATEALATWAEKSDREQLERSLKSLKALPPVMSSTVIQRQQAAQEAVDKAIVVSDKRQTVVLDALGAALDDSDSVVREQAARGLGYCGNIRAIRFLNRAASDRDVSCRVATSKALRSFNVDEAIELLFVLLRDAMPLVRQAAADSLGHLGPYERVSISRIIEALMSALKDDDIGVVVSACRSLAFMQDNRSISPIAALLKSKEPQLRAEALFSLQLIGDGPSSSLILPLLKDRNSMVRLNAVDALVGIMGQGALVHIRKLRNDDDLFVRERVREVIKRLGPTKQKK